ncbi:FACT complex subunit spt16 [Ascosphaera acerosa]|nr:FACT complex subunit spt16 [Ascosphaera acerosa]
MAEAIKIDRTTFFDRLQSLYSAWKAEKRSSAPQGLFDGASSIVILMGKTEESNYFQKNNAMHFWLLGYEFPATLFVFTLDAMYIVTTAKKAKHLECLENGPIAVNLLITSKDPEQKAKSFDQCLSVIRAAGNKVGVLPKDTSAGPFAEEWRKLLNDCKDVEQVDIAPALSLHAFSIKSQDELISMRNAAFACTGIMTEYFIDEMSETIDQERKVTHKALSMKVDGKIDDAKFFNKLPGVPKGFDAGQLDWAYGPVIQSGGKYDLRASAQSDDNNISAGVILATFGLRYRTYCAMLARSFFVDPTSAQESAYSFLLELHAHVLKSIKPGVAARDVYGAALDKVKADKPELADHLVSNIGAAIGIELRDNNMVLSGKNGKTLRAGMTFCLTVGFADIKDPVPKNKKTPTFSVVLTDTIRVGPEGVHVLTKGASTKIEDVSFYFGDEEPAKPAPAADSATILSKNITKTKLRAERSTQVDEGAEQRRREHQKELHEKKNREGLARFAGTTGDANGTVQKKFRRFESYKRDNQLPPRVKDLAIYVDQKAATVIVPIMGRPVPFHINAIKNASKSDEGEYAYLRINFLSPGQGVGRKDDQPFEDPSAHFVRNLTLRSKDANRLAQVAQDITELRKDVLRREQERKELEDVVEQDKLVEVRHKRPVKLDDVFLRPPLDGKRVPGIAEIHQNGLRYVSPIRGEHVDVLFSNVKHLFFQPCTHEMIVIIHVHLKTPIMIGKRKTKDVQFYREATEMQFDETGNRRRKHRYGDEEEFEAEQEERRRRAALDKEFKTFAEKISDAGRDEGVDVDIPFREIGFQGVPNRSNVLIQPTTDAIVQLTEPPFLVLTLSEIEVAHLERVQFGLKNFDLVFVFKDFHRPPVHINTIPVESLDAVKDWLDSVDIAFSEGPLNLNWGAIMKTVTTDPEGFFKDGGWGFLAAESDSEDEEDEDEDSAFEVSESELNATDESSEDDSDFDDDASADESEDYSGGSESDEGEDWDELEEKAKRADRKGGNGDDDKARKRKR